MQPNVIARNLRRLTILLALVGLALSGGTALAKGKKKKKKKPVATAPATPAEGTLSIFSITNGALVEVDGKAVGNLPLKGVIKLAPGQHSIRVSMRGWTEHSDTFEIKPGEETELEIDLIPVAGIVKLKAQKEGATVKVNGKVVGVTPFDQDVSVGKVTIEVSLPGFYDHKEQVDIRPGKTYDFDIKLKPLPADQVPGGGPEFYETWWFWTVIGVALAGGATATAIVLTQDTATAPVADFTVQIP